MKLYVQVAVPTSIKERPSIAARTTPPTSALLPAAFKPALAARMPPVAAPEMIAFQGSSYRCGSCQYIVKLSTTTVTYPPSS